MYIVKGYCAGILIIPEKKVEEADLSIFMSETKSQLLAGELKIHFASQVQVASEVCIDIYEEPERKYRHDLSKAFKR